MTTTNAVAMTGAEFRRLVSSVLPCAATDATLPALNAVHLEITPHGAYAAATDRYAFAVARHGSPAPDRRTAQATIPRSAALAMLRLVHRREPLTTLRISHDGWVTLRTTSGTTYRTHGIDAHRAGQFPDWRKLFTRLLATEPLRTGQPVHLNPVYLARFKTASDDLTGLRVRVHQAPSNQTLIVSAGAWFLGALVAIRVPGGDTPYAVWRADLSSPAAPVRAA